jgi:soluble lytic murein transglycosylase
LERPSDAYDKGYFVKYFKNLISSAVVLPFFMAFAAQAMTSESVRDTDVNSAPVLLNNKEKQQYAAIFSAIKSGDWASAQQLINNAPKGPMSAMARAELYLAPNSPRVDASQLQSLLEEAAYLPQAEQLERLAIKRGAENLPQRPGTQRFSYLGSAPKRDLPDNIGDAASLRDQIQIHIRNDDPASAERIIESNSNGLSAPALTELRYRVAWSYYIENDDTNARRLANTARSSGGDWGVQAQWVFALSSWRLKDYSAAYEGFDHVSRYASNDDFRAAGLFWGARAAMAAKQPGQIQIRLQNASRYPETFYGLLASEALGMEPLARKQVRATKLDWNRLKKQENVQIAVGLAEIGESNLADQTIRFQSRIGETDRHSELAQLAGSLNMPATQLWLSHYGPANSDTDALARYPMPNWQPSGGWRVDRSLVMAHALQESAFRTAVVSPAGARGLMQVRPGTANDMARDKGQSFNAIDLDRPSINLEYGQSYMEKLRDMSATGGLLPKVIAAYNAGPAPVSRWNTEIRDNGDPLLFVESIPYWETRGYVAIILRNYWIYEMRSGKSGGSMMSLAQYLWPRFPDKNGSIAVRASGSGVSHAAR